MLRRAAVVITRRALAASTSLPHHLKLASSPYFPSRFSSYGPGEHTIQGAGGACVIRHATVEDCPALLEMVTALAVYEREPDAVKTTVEMLERDGFGPNPFFTCLIAEVPKLGPGPVGFALTFNTYSTWEGKCLFLEDLFVHEHMRGAGIGKLMLRTVVAEARESGCARVNWSCLKWNSAASDFYKDIGAIVQDEWEGYRMSPKEMDNFLES